MIRLKFPGNYRCCNLPRIIKSDIDIVSWYDSSSSSSKYWKSKSWRGNSNRHGEMIEGTATRGGKTCFLRAEVDWNVSRELSLVGIELPAYKVQKTAPTSFHVCVCERNREARGGETEERTLLPVRSARRPRRRRDHFNTRQVSLCDIQRVILPPFDIQSLSIRSRNDGFRTSLWTWRSFEYP